MKETTAQRATFLIVTCPHCQSKTYLDEEDDYGEGRIGPDGRKMKCQKCEKMMLVVESSLA